MNLLKTILSPVLILTLLAGLLIPAAAAQIAPEQEQQVTIVDDEIPVVFQFIPNETGYYGFYSYNSQGCDPSGYIMDANRNPLCSGDDTEESTDFFIVWHMTAGETYYLAATSFSGAAEYSVQVKPLSAPTSMEFEQTAYVGSLLGTLYPEVRFYPRDSVREEVTLSSSNEQVVSVGELGELYLGIPGTATVTATSLSGLTASCTVTVESPPELQQDIPLTLDASEGEQYLHFIAPAAGWYGIQTSGDEIEPDVEVLDGTLDGIPTEAGSLPKGNVFSVFCLDKGELCYFDISFTASTGTTQLTLEKLSPLTGLSFPQDGISGYVDTVCRLQPVTAPTLAIPEALTWKSSDEDVVYVDDTGFVSYLQPGNATITVTSETGKTASVAVTVLDVPTDPEVSAWGICGPNLQWQLSIDGLLTVTGSGDMYDLYDNPCHWDDYKYRITRVSLPEGLTNIGYGAFLYCENLEAVTLPDSVRTIGGNAFSCCYSLAQVTLPGNLEWLGSSAFEECYALEQIVLPDSLKRLPCNAFNSCTSLSQVTLPANLISIGDQAFSGCCPETVTLPDGLKTLGFSAFANSGLTRLELPEGITELRDYALANCSLQELTLPATVTGLGCGFATGNDLTTLRFLGDAPTFDPYALDYLDVTAYYPAGNPTWTEEVRQDYGGTVTWVPEGAAGATLRGSVNVSMTLTLSGQTATAHNGSYSFTDLQPGTYTLTATATNHVTRTYTVTLEGTDLTLDVTLNLLGDIDGNGRVNVGDVAKLNSHIRGTAPLTDEYQLLCANVNGGSLNMGDTAALYSHVRGTSKLY